MLILRYFTNVLKPPPIREWKDTGGTLYLSFVSLPSISYGNIVQVVSNNTSCESLGELYECTRKRRTYKEGLPDSIRKRSRKDDG